MLFGVHTSLDGPRCQARGLPGPKEGGKKSTSVKAEKLWRSAAPRSLVPDHFLFFFLLRSTPEKKSNINVSGYDLGKMDPLSALSIATGIVTFVDFGAKLVSLSLEIKKSEEGRPAALSALMVESRDLSGHAAHARRKIASLQVRYPR